jgi:hypothetical protein
MAQFFLRGRSTKEKSDGLGKEGGGEKEETGSIDYALEHLEYEGEWGEKGNK